jgi:HK97 family phage prohead protease
VAPATADLRQHQPGNENRRNALPYPFRKNGTGFEPMSSKLPKELAAGQNGVRFITLTAEARSAIDAEARTVEVAFASETPVPRFWGNEILDMNSRSIRMDRMKSGGAVLMDHDWTDQVGVVDSVQIGADRVARAVLRFGKSARASEVFQDLVDGIRTNVSVGYQIHSAVLESDDDGDQTYRITDWEPYEISVVAIPADTSVGVGRAAPKLQENTMETATPAVVTAAPVDTTAIQRAGADAERTRSASILGIADAYKRYNLNELAAEAIRTGLTVDEFKSKAMERMASAPKPTAEIGMNDKEKRRYSFVNMMNALANPNDRGAQERAAFEFECSTAARERSERTGKPGVTIPFDVINRGHAQRDLTAGGSTTGAKLVATDLLAEDFITLLRQRMVINSLARARSLACRATSPSRA